MYEGKPVEERVIVPCLVVKPVFAVTLILIVPLPVWVAGVFVTWKTPRPY